MMEVKLESLIRALSDYSQEPQLDQALALANQKVAEGSRADYLTLFAESWNEVAPGERLSKIFGTYDMREAYSSRKTSNEEVLKNH